MIKSGIFALVFLIFYAIAILAGTNILVSQNKTLSLSPDQEALIYKPAFLYILGGMVALTTLILILKFKRKNKSLQAKERKIINTTQKVLR